MFRYQKIILISIFFLVLVISIVSAFREPYFISFNDNSRCKQELSLATPEDTIKILMPDGYCEDIGINLKIEEYWCGTGGIPKLNFNMGKEGNYTKCEISLKKLYEDTCWDERTRLNIGEITNKYWEIQFGLEDPIGASYVEKWEIKVLSKDDYDEKCLELSKHRLGLWVGIPLLEVSFVFSILPRKRKNKGRRSLEIIGISAGAILTLLGVLRII